MRPKYQLQTTHDQYHEAAVAVDKAREGSKMVKVSRDTLNHLLNDHSKFIQLHNPDLTGDK